MIKQLHIENFRSIKKSDLPLGKFTVITGANNSGKSSFIYSLLTLKNLLNNPNQALDNFFVYGGLNLGGFEQTVFQKDEDLSIILEIIVEKEDFRSTYKVELNPKESLLELKIRDTKLHLKVAFPYSGKKYITKMVKVGSSPVSVLWNGISATTGSNEKPVLFSILEEAFLPINTLSHTDVIPLQRGFTKPYYATVPLQNQVTNEDEIATLLATDHDLAANVSHYLQKIVDRALEVRFTPNTANFYLQTQGKDSLFVTDIVNEGLGTNQLVTMLAKILYRNNQVLCMDEPEIHLHPSLINRFVASLVEIADLSEKQFLLSTHSEQFLAALLRQVADGKLAPDDLCVYYLTKDENGSTHVERQEVNGYGQIKGGYKSFLEAELDNLQALFQLDKA